MKTRHVFTFFFLASLTAQAQPATCTEWESKLRAEINAANACEPGYRDCMAKSANNPMRELGYCKNVVRQCESLDGPIENQELKLQVEHYKKQCS
jgi:hypothetical protein